VRAMLAAWLGCDVFTCKSITINCKPSIDVILHLSSVPFGGTLATRRESGQRHIKIRLLQLLEVNAHMGMQHSRESYSWSNDACVA
jgi:hypothetical protein